MLSNSRDKLFKFYVELYLPFKLTQAKGLKLSFYLFYKAIKSKEEFQLSSRTR